MSIALIYFNNRDHQKVIPLKTGKLVIGRRPDCDVQIPDLLVSRQHCRVSQNDQSVFVQDLSTPNGTYVNRERIEKVELAPGDVIAVGSIQFTVQIDGQPSTIENPKKQAQSGQADSFGPPSTKKKETVLSEPSSSSGSDVLSSDILAELGLDLDD